MTRVGLGARLALVAATSITLWSCQKAKPPALVEEPPDGLPAPAPVPLSRFSAPLDYDFTSLTRVVERVVPRTFGSLDSVRMIGTDERRHYAFVANRGKFTAFADGRLIHLRATLTYSARGFYKPMIGPTIGAGCGKGPEAERPRIVIELATPITLTEQWHLASRARVVDVKPASTEDRDKCNVTILHVDVTDKVIAAARAGISAHLKDIDRKVAEVDLTPRLTALWQTMGRPIRLADGVWLTLGPEQLQMGAVRGRGRVLTVPVVLDARPKIVTSATQPAADSAKLPPLGHDTASSGFHVMMDALVDYTTASRAITTALAHKKLNAGGRSVVVETVRVTPAAKGRLALTMDFSGDAKGTIQLVGLPVLDAAKSEIGVPDLDFDLDTDSQLINTYSWLKSDDLRGAFRERAHIPVGPALDKGRTLLLAGLNRKIGDALTLTSTVDSVTVQGLFVTRAGIVVRAEASGQAGVSVKQK